MPTQKHSLPDLFVLGLIGADLVLMVLWGLVSRPLLNHRDTLVIHACFAGFGGCLASLALTPAIWVSEKNRGNRTPFLIILLGLAMFICGILMFGGLFLNSIAEREAPVVVQTKVLAASKVADVGRNGQTLETEHLEVNVRGWRPGRPFETLILSAEKSLKRGEPLEIKVHTGLLGYEWVEVP